MAKIEQLFARFGEKADFATIYIAEAHAAEEWSLKHSSNAELDGKWDVAQPKTMDERMKVFTDWYEWLSPTSPHFVDTISDEARFAFNALPERLYIIEDGKVVYRGDAGPFGCASQAARVNFSKQTPCACSGTTRRKSRAGWSRASPGTLTRSSTRRWTRRSR